MGVTSVVVVPVPHRRAWSTRLLDGLMWVVVTPIWYCMVVPLLWWYGPE